MAAVSPLPSEGRMSQNELILARLRDGPLTAIEALQGIGCLRLAARIDELRRQGHAIVAEKVRPRRAALAEALFVAFVERHIGTAA